MIGTSTSRLLPGKGCKRIAFGGIGAVICYWQQVFALGASAHTHFHWLYHLDMDPTRSQFLILYIIEFQHLVMKLSVFSNSTSPRLYMGARA